MYSLIVEEEEEEEEGETRSTYVGPTAVGTDEDASGRLPTQGIEVLAP